MPCIVVSPSTAGANWGFRRWNDTIKREIKRSRAETTRRLAEAINALPAGSRPALVSSSAVGFYGTSERDTYNEDSPSGSDFLAQVCQDWEKEAQAAETRVAIIRTGIVMSKQGGALAKLLPVFALFLGAMLLCVCKLQAGGGGAPHSCVCCHSTTQTRRACSASLWRTVAMTRTARGGLCMLPLKGLCWWVLFACVIGRAGSVSRTWQGTDVAMSTVLIAMLQVRWQGVVHRCDVSRCVLKASLMVWGVR